MAKRAAQMGKGFDIGFRQTDTRQVGIGEGREVERFKENVLELEVSVEILLIFKIIIPTH